MVQENKTYVNVIANVIPFGVLLAFLILQIRLLFGSKVFYLFNAIIYVRVLHNSSISLF